MRMVGNSIPTVVELLTRKSLLASNPLSCRLYLSVGCQLLMTAHVVREEVGISKYYTYLLWRYYYEDLGLAFIFSVPGFHVTQ